MMEQNKTCPLCEENLYSSIGIGCKMCGMPLENKDDEFCSSQCEVTYKINNI
jgi:hypothetical protein